MGYARGRSTESATCNRLLTTGYLFPNYDAGGKHAAEYAQVSPPATGKIEYVTNNYQGSTSVVTDNGGSVTSRHDYLPFGEEIGAGVGSRTTAKAFSQGDMMRQKYAGMETDAATGMAHTLWRKQDNWSGRWTSPDPYGGSMSTSDPQSFNRYTYCDNDPVNHVDLTGLSLADIGVYQTENPAVAATLDTESMRRFKVYTSAGPVGRKRAHHARVVAQQGGGPQSSSSQTQYNVTGDASATPERIAAVNNAANTLRAQSATADAAFGLFDDDKTSGLIFYIMNDQDFLRIRGVEKDTQAVTDQNGSNTRDPVTGKETGVGAQVIIRASAIDKAVEDRDRKAGNETKLEAILSHEVGGHARDLTTDTACYFRARTEALEVKKLIIDGKPVEIGPMPYQQRPGEVSADRATKIIGMERVNNGFVKPGGLKTNLRFGGTLMP